MRRRVALAVTALVLTALTAGCVPSITVNNGDTAPSGSTGAGAIDWRSCSAEARKLNPNVGSAITFECGSVTVPQDWRTAKDGKASDGKTFQLALMRARSRSQSGRIGSIVFNPGGPGGSGFDYLPYLAPKLTGLLPKFDIIGFDPRGVGRSAPVECISNQDLDASFGYDPDPVSDAAFQGVVALNRHIGEACGAKYGEELSLFSTEQAARDMDAIRAALGEPKLNYLGFSYGTLLGAVYAQLFPTKIRAMVLDGAVDPTQGASAGSEGQAKGFERALDNFSAWCKAHPGNCPISADPRGAIVNEINKGRTHPVPYTDGRKATSGWVFYAVISSLYSQDAWPYLARAIDDLRKGDARVAFILADSYAERGDNGDYKNLFDANNAVNCADGDYPTVEEIRTLQGQWRAKYPLFGASSAIGLLSCSLWPAKKDPYPTGRAEGAPPIVVIGTTGDPATPYESTAKLANMLGVGTVLTWQGEGHTAYPGDPSTAGAAKASCLNDAVNGYFTDLTVPPKGKTC